MTDEPDLAQIRMDELRDQRAEAAELTIGGLYEALGPNGSTVIDGWRISRVDDPPEAAP